MNEKLIEELRHIGDDPMLVDPDAVSGLLHEAADALEKQKKIWNELKLLFIDGADLVFTGGEVVAEMSEFEKEP